MRKKSKSKAINLLKKVVVTTKHNSRLEVVKSVGTLRDYRDCIKLFLDWCDLNAVSSGLIGSKAVLIAYLEEKSEVYQQKTLDQHRMALNMGYHKKLPFIKSLLDTLMLARDYRLDEVLKIVKSLEAHNAISMLICYFSGLRAHEFATLQRADEGSPSDTRQWSNQLFVLEENYCVYLVTGKGGLCRQVAIPNSLANVIESRRLKQPRNIVDREVFYQMNYALGYGKALSQSFTRASIKHLNRSTGLHGLRHSYAKNRIKKLTKNGFNLEPAKLIVSQELGHFRASIINCYLR